MRWKKLLQKRKGIFFQPKFIITITLTLSLILIIEALFEFYFGRKEIVRIMSEEAFSLIEAIRVSGDNATLAFRQMEGIVTERLLNNARIVEKLDRLGWLSHEILAQIAHENNLSQITIFSKEGHKILSSHKTIHKDLLQLHQSQEFIQPILEGHKKEIIIGSKKERYGRGEIYAVAVQRSHGGAVVVNIDTKEMQQLREEVGIERLINDMADKRGIIYVMIEDKQGILIPSKNTTGISTIAHDLFLMNVLDKKKVDTRLITLNGCEILETVAPFYIDGITPGLLRIGLKTDYIAEADARTKRRLIVISLVLLLGGVLIFSFIYLAQNYKLLDEAYLRTKTYTGNILQNMANGVIAIDKTGVITLFNRAAENIFNVPRKKALGKNFLEVIQDDFVLEKTLKSGKTIKDFETEYTIGGKRTILSFNTFVLKDKTGQVNSTVAVIKDLTIHRIMEENLNQRKKLTAMGELASGVAHEIRNPLNAIGVIAQRLSKEFEPETDKDEYRSLTATVVREVQRINMITERFLKFARPSKLDIRKTNMSELLNEIIDLLSPEAQSNNIVISRDYTTSILLPLDRNQMKQAILNLLQNAIHAINNDGTIYVIADVEECHTKLTIKDTGKGIPRDNLDKIFNLYFTTKEDGSGIGLSIAHQILMAHRGRIEVESEINVGTTFRIYLPNRGDNSC
ncbi:MAG: two-component system sensor histidine kinase NtrB [bacterium]